MAKTYDKRHLDRLVSDEQLETNKNDNIPHFGFTITKKIGSAIVRNKIKRRLKSIIRELLKYKDKGVKISITNNSIQYSDASMFQGILRSYNGDTREDLHNLYNPFLKAFEWYDNTEDESIYQYFYKSIFYN